MITILKATMHDIDAIRLLYKETIEKVAIKDYTPAQVAAWSSSWDDLERWKQNLLPSNFIKLLPLTKP